MSEQETLECNSRANTATEGHRAYYQQPRGSGFKLDEALDALVTLIVKGQNLCTQISRRTISN